MIQCQACKREITEDSVELKITGAVYNFCNKNCCWVWLGERIGSISKNADTDKMTMPFGKYKGENIEDLPSDYITWVLTNTSVGPKLQKCLQDQLDLREGKGVKR